MLGLASLSARSTQHALRFSAQTASMSSLSWVKKRAAPIRAPPGQHVAWLSAKAGDEAWHLRDTEEKVIMMAKGLVSYYDRTESNRASDRDQMLDECIDSLSAFRHTVNLNTRLQTMFTSSEASRMGREAREEYRRIVELCEINNFDHSVHGDAASDLISERLTKRFTLTPKTNRDNPKDAPEPVELAFAWELARSRRAQGSAPGGLNEFSAALHANGTRIVYVTELSASVSEQAVAAIYEHLTPAGAPPCAPSEFGWLLAFLASFPSDEAFDVVSGALGGAPAP